MTSQPALGTALADLAEARARYWGRWRSDPWTHDEEIESALATAWAATVKSTEGREQVIRLAGAPPCDAGAPSPVLVAHPAAAFLGYDDADGARRLLTFQHVDSVVFGGAGDESLHGHRLWEHGLEACEFQEVLNSAWIAQREQENSVHPRHRPGWHARLRHFVYTFPGETFECIAGRYVVGDRAGAPAASLAALEP
ncbi:MAG: hypothetical protein J7518_04800 [Nocardioidaceae bacterium]|nr:hypothetical protein [Nocardioidaceae bacterium]